MKDRVKDIIILVLSVTLIVTSVFNTWIHYKRSQDFNELIEINKRFVKTVLEMHECGYGVAEPKPKDREVEL